MNKTAGDTVADLFPVWLIGSKVHPTRQRVHLLERPMLLGKLDRCMDARLSLIHAPAGYGKTTLLADWRIRLLADDALVCWLSLDKDDNELFQLLTYIAFSLSSGGVDFRAAGISDGAFLNDLSPRNFLGIISHVVAAQSKKVVLMLDDFESLDAETVAGAIRPLLDYAPDNLHIAIAGRDDRELHITDLETQGLVTRIRADSLRFSLAELVDFFGDVMPKNAVGKLYGLTEGWPVTVQMMRNALAENRDMEGIPESFGDTGSVLNTYLSEQIFNNLDSGLRDFLMDISIVERISIPFANFLRDREDSAAWFDGARPISALVLPVEKLDHNYRLHALFQDYLYGKLTAVRPQRAAQLHTRAARWYAGKGNIVMAVKHAMRAGRPEQAAEIVEDAGGITIWLREGLTRLRSVLKLLDEGSVEERPRMLLIRCLIAIKDGKICRARNDFDRVLKRHRELLPGLDAAAKERTEHEILLLESLLALYEGKALSGDLCDQLYENISRVDSTEHVTLGHHFNILCAAQVQRGMFEEARSYAERAIEEFRLFGSLYGETYINFHLGDIAFARGQGTVAEDRYRTGLKLVRRHFSDDKGMKLIACVLMAELKYELDRTDSLSNIIETIPKQLEEREAWFDIYAAGYLTASNIEFRKYGLDAALAVIDRAQVYATAQKLERLQRLLVFQKMELLLRAGDEGEAGALLRDSGIPLDDYGHPDSSETAWRGYSAAAHAITWLQIREGRYDEALTSLSRFSGHARTHGHVRSSMQLEILRSLAWQGKGERTKAREHLEVALNLFRRSGFVRTFVDGGREVKSILQDCIESAEFPALHESTVEQAQIVLGHFGGFFGDSDPGELLSRREHDVLAQLVHGYSNKVIARKIDISENTVRFHLKNIFAKLHVDNRLQAVTVARKRALI